MFMFHFIRKSLKTAKHHPRLGGLEILKYIGPGLLVTVGFIDPGNWASTDTEPVQKPISQKL